MNTPILDMLEKINHENRTRFYMPGHKGGRLLGDEKSLFSFDITEIEGSDNLHAPEGAILEAEKLAARAFGADRTYFLVGGASCGIHAMISSVAGDGDLIIMDRACHKSAVYALETSGATAVFLSPKMEEGNIPGSISPEDLSAAIREYPQAKAVYLTSPNYYGRCQDLEELIRISHGANIPVLVDEAHGAHFAFSPRLPKTAMELGADMAVESAHKTLPALTQTAYLHIKEHMSGSRLKEALRRFQSTSPSYLLMASLDYARAFMEEHTDELETFISQLTEIFHLEITPHRDVTRLVFSMENMTGMEAAEILRKEYGMECEMADYDHVVMIPTMGNTVEELSRLYTAMEEIKNRPGQKNKIEVTLPKKNVLRMRDYMQKEGREVPLKDAVGKLAGGMVYLYPPGIPILLPGEKISAQTALELEHYEKEGLSLHGLRNGRNILIFDS